MDKSEKKKYRGADLSALRYFFSGQAAHWLPKNCLDSELIRDRKSTRLNSSHP